MKNSRYPSKRKLLAVCLLTICFSLTALQLTDCSGLPAKTALKAETAPSESGGASISAPNEIQDDSASGPGEPMAPAKSGPSPKTGGGTPVHPVLAAQPSDEFPQSLEAVTGLFTYYNQTDERWANEKFGPKDPILTHGCGPTVLAMLVSSYTSTRLDPLAAAAWAAQNGYCIPGDGSSHAIIEGGCAAFGLSAVPVPKRTPEAIMQALESGKVVVALMGSGYFTDSGHFIVIVKALENGKVRIADPASLEHCRVDWPLEFLISQLKGKAYSGGPLWAVGYQE